MRAIRVGANGRPLCWGRRAALLLTLAFEVSTAHSARAQEPAHKAVDASPTPSNDSGSDAARRAVTVGLAKYEAGEYRDAAALFLEAYAANPDANLLYNAARCYERLGENRKAIVRYQQFMATPDSDEHGRARANAALQRLEQAEFLALRKAPSDQSGALDTESNREAHASNTSSSGVPWFLMGVGTAALGAGAWSTYSGWELSQRVTSDPAFGDEDRVHPLTYSQAKSLIESRDRRLTWGAVGLGLGGALIATSVIWWLVEDEPSADGESAALEISASARGASIVWEGRF